MNEQKRREHILRCATMIMSAEKELKEHNVEGSIRYTILALKGMLMLNDGFLFEPKEDEKEN